MVRRSFLLVALSLIAPVVSHGQLLDPYARITDPRGIARLSGHDTARTKSVCFHGDPAWRKVDSLDHFGIAADDTGSGIITHIWTTSANLDTVCTVKLFIDDTLRLKDYYKGFFRTVRGALRPPLDTTANGATTWDVQIPYRHGFKLSASTSNPNVYFGVQWHTAPLEDLPATNSVFSTGTESQLTAEWILAKPSSPWNDPFAVSLTRTDTLVVRSRLVVAEIDGPKMLEVLRFQSSSYELADLDSTWLNIYWDRCPRPSVHVPLKDFFLSPVVVTSVRSFQLKADRDSGFVCYFPMPFRDHASIELVRTGSRPLAIRSLIQITAEPIDRNSYGYFHADFHESNPTQYHVNHPVIHTTGRGRYIGMGFGVMEHPYQEFLEGDPIFDVDSLPEFHIRYTGGEDYFDAGWWFPNGTFTLPFAGYTHQVDQFYRFHYLDCYEFNNAFDFDLQPGPNADVYDHFRTVGYFYQHWTPFWTNRDTVIAGEEWTVEGAGYGKKQPIAIVLSRIGAGDTIWVQATSDVSGRFSLTLQVTPTWKPGVYVLSVNGESSPNKCYVLRKSAIRAITDYHPILLRAGDSLLVSGTGFAPGERVYFYLDSIPLGQSTIADSANGILATLRMPYLAEHAYLLVGRGEQSGNTTAEDRVSLTRTLNFEFEELMPPVFKTAGACFAENVAYYWEATWSKQTFVYFKPDSVLKGAVLEFAFAISHPDTFAIEFHHSTSLDLGQYGVTIDGHAVGQIDGGHPDLNWDPLPSGPIPFGIHFLDSGLHRIRFTCTGKSDSARAYWLEPDNMVLKPVTVFPQAPGTLQRIAVTGGDVPLAIQFFPNPLHGQSAMISFRLRAEDTAFGFGKVLVFVYDQLGRSHPVTVSGTMIDGEYHGTCLLAQTTPGTYFVRTVVMGESGQRLELPVVPLVVE